jgi:hypothetical protein
MPSEFAVSDKVRDILQRSTIEGGQSAYWLKLPKGKLDRPIYEAVDKVLVGAGGKWDRKLRAHVFGVDPRPLIARAVETGSAVNVQQARQAFYTPDPVADRVIALAEIEPGAIRFILEPSFGGGSLIRAIKRAYPERQSMVVHGKEMDRAAFDRFNAPTVSGLAATGSWRAEPHLYPTMHLECVDFLTLTPPANAREDGYDSVVMNPPFTKGQDVEHVTHAFRFIKPDGLLVAIMPGSIKTRHRLKKDHAFQQLYVDNGGRTEDVPEGAFIESGTSIHTVIVTLRRRGETK